MKRECKNMSASCSVWTLFRSWSIFHKGKGCIPSTLVSCHFSCPLASQVPWINLSYPLADLLGAVPVLQVPNHPHLWSWCLSTPLLSHLPGCAGKVTVRSPVTILAEWSMLCEVPRLLILLFCCLCSQPPICPLLPNSQHLVLVILGFCLALFLSFRFVHFCQFAPSLFTAYTSWWCNSVGFRRWVCVLAKRPVVGIWLPLGR